MFLKWIISGDILLYMFKDVIPHLYNVPVPAKMIMLNLQNQMLKLYKKIAINFAYMEILGDFKILF